MIKSVFKMDPALAAFVRSLSNSANVPNMTQVEAHALARLLNRTLNVCTSRHIQVGPPFTHTPTQSQPPLNISSSATACHQRRSHTHLTIRTRQSSSSPLHNSTRQSLQTATSKHHHHTRIDLHIRA